jgi:excisionase family DNA binding protein
VPPKDKIPPVLLTVDDVTHVLGVSRSKIYDLISKGQLPYVKIGAGRSGGVRFRPEDLRQFADNHLVQKKSLAEIPEKSIGRKKT